MFEGLEALQKLGKAGVDVLILKHKLMGWILVKGTIVEPMKKEDVIKYLQESV